MQVFLAKMIILTNERKKWRMIKMIIHKKRNINLLNLIYNGKFAHF